MARKKQQNMPRDSRGITRKSGGQRKDPTVYYIIASEGTETEPGYFELISGVLSSMPLGRLVKVEPLRRQDTNSSFKRVIQQLDDYRNKYMLKGNDELWCLIDKDRIPVRNIAEADRLCRQKGYEFCLTTPCFELWLVLHIKDPTNITPEEITKILENRKVGNRSYMEIYLNDLCMNEWGCGYRKNNPPSQLIDNIPFAIQRAFVFQLEEKHWSLTEFCTRLHILIQRIFNVDPPNYLI